jgi:hypothetical protein
MILRAHISAVPPHTMRTSATGSAISSLREFLSGAFYKKLVILCYLCHITSRIYNIALKNQGHCVRECSAVKKNFQQKTKSIIFLAKKNLFI